MDAKDAVPGTATGTGWIVRNMAFLVSMSLVFIALLMAGAIGYLSRHSQAPFELMRLFFAMGILTGLGLLFAFAITVYIWGPTGSNGAGKEVFDACVKVIPPIITLILGFYFGTVSMGDKNQPKNEQGNHAPQKPSLLEGERFPLVDDQPKPNH